MNTTSLVVSSRHLAALGLLCLAPLAACSDGTAPAEQRKQESNATERSGGGESGASGEASASGESGAASASGAEGTTSPKTDCVDVSGPWTGAVKGAAKANPKDAEPTDPLEGTANVTFGDDTEEPGTYKITQGQFDVEIDMGGLLGKVRTKQVLTGEVKCGKLNGIASGQGLVTKLSGTATCTFDANGCKGDWVVNDGNGALAARGTFELKK